MLNAGLLLLQVATELFSTAQPSNPFPRKSVPRKSLAVKLWLWLPAVMEGAIIRETYGFVFDVKRGITKLHLPDGLDVYYAKLLHEDTAFWLGVEVRHAQLGHFTDKKELARTDVFGLVVQYMWPIISYSVAACDTMVAAALVHLQALFRADCKPYLPLIAKAVYYAAKRAPRDCIAMLRWKPLEKNGGVPVGKAYLQLPPRLLAQEAAKALKDSARGEGGEDEQQHMPNKRRAISPTPTPTPTPSLDSPSSNLLLDDSELV